MVALNAVFNRGPIVYSASESWKRWRSQAPWESLWKPDANTLWIQIQKFAWPTQQSCPADPHLLHSFPSELSKTSGGRCKFPSSYRCQWLKRLQGYQRSGRGVYLPPLGVPSVLKTVLEEKTHTWREGRWKQTFGTVICSTFCTTNALCIVCLESINRYLFSQKAGLWRYSIKLQCWAEINNNNKNIIYVNPLSDLNQGN